jgi:hypothetical protein
MTALLRTRDDGGRGTRGARGRGGQASGTSVAAGQRHTALAQCVATRRAVARQLAAKACDRAMECLERIGIRFQTAREGKRRMEIDRRSTIDYRR